MSKTITLRVDDDVYQMIKKAASGVRRTISNFLEFAAISYISEETFVSDREMGEILRDKSLVRNLNQGKKQIEEGRYKIVG